MVVDTSTPQMQRDVGSRLEEDGVMHREDLDDYSALSRTTNSPAHKSHCVGKGLSKGAGVGRGGVAKGGPYRDHIPNANAGAGKFSEML